MTKAEFLINYRRELLAMYDWANDITKFDKYMQSVEDTLLNGKLTWNPDGPAVKAAFGGKQPTLKTLRGLK